MAADGSTQKKKIRLEEKENVLNLFSSNQDLFHELKEASAVLHEIPCALCLVKITNCDGNEGSPFSRIFCKTRRNIDNEKDNCIFSFDSIFEEGWKILNSYIRDPSFEPPEKPKEALNKLLEFLLNRDDSEKCLVAKSGIRNESEVTWCQTLVHHYFSKLALHSDYVTDHHNPEKNYVCSCGQAFEGIYGDTSIGHEKTWHGYVDILLGSPSQSLVPVVSTHKPVSQGGRDVGEIGEGEEDDSYVCRDQVIGQCIVNSFLQMKRHPEYANFLIPLIGVSQTNILFFFYDAEHDILVESAPQCLFDTHDQLNISTVLTTWLVLNYKFFCSGVSSVMLNKGYKCNFPAFAGDTYELYKNELKYGCSISKNVRSKFFEPWTMGKFTFYRSEQGNC